MRYFRFVVGEGVGIVGTEVVREGCRVDDGNHFLFAKHLESMV